MAELFASIARVAIPRIGQSKAKDDGIRSWISHGIYTVDSNSGRSIELSGISLSEIVPYLSFDYERFALSSWESFRVALLELSPRRSMGWPLLKLYYAAFFASHAIMRLCGEAVVKIERPQVEVLQVVADGATGASIPISPGMYAIRLREQGPGRLYASINKQADGQGAHEGFWVMFDQFLQRQVDKAILDQAPDAGALLAGVNELQPLFRPHKARRSAWLSAVRNEINYQHRHGVWQPSRMDAAASSLLAAVGPKASAAIRLDYSLDKDTTSAFIAASHFLSALNFEAAEFVAAGSTASRAFGQHWRRLTAAP